MNLRGEFMGKGCLVESVNVPVIMQERVDR